MPAFRRTRPERDRASHASRPAASALKAPGSRTRPRTGNRSPVAARRR
jgi:hypothetical protein